MPSHVFGLAAGVKAGIVSRMVLSPKSHICCAMPLTPEQEHLEHKLRVELLTKQTELFKRQVRWKPWKAMAIAAAAGAGATGLIIVIFALLLRSTLY